MWSAVVDHCQPIVVLMVHRGLGGATHGAAAWSRIYHAQLVVGLLTGPGHLAHPRGVVLWSGVVVRGGRGGGSGHDQGVVDVGGFGGHGGKLGHQD